VSLEVGRGEVVGLLGPNGAGKTTIVDILSTLTRPDRGHVSIAGFDVVSQPASVRRAIMLTGQQVVFCTGFVPLDQYPQWIRPVVQHQPLSYAIEAMRGLSLGGPVLRPTLATLLWSAGIVVVCVIPMVLGYRRASMRG
jgi:ABC-type transport system involved in cytochrome c biogenesis ATPase subunit